MPAQAAPAPSTLSTVVISQIIFMAVSLLVFCILFVALLAIALIKSKRFGASRRWVFILCMPPALMQIAALTCVLFAISFEDNQVAASILKGIGKLLPMYQLFFLLTEVIFICKLFLDNCKVVGELSDETVKKLKIATGVFMSVLSLPLLGLSVVFIAMWTMQSIDSSKRAFAMWSYYSLGLLYTMFFFAFIALGIVMMICAVTLYTTVRKVMKHTSQRNPYRTVIAITILTELIIILQIVSIGLGIAGSFIMKETLLVVSYIANLCLLVGFLLAIILVFGPLSQFTASVKNAVDKLQQVVQNKVASPQTEFQLIKSASSSPIMPSSSPISSPRVLISLIAQDESSPSPSSQADESVAEETVQIN